MTSRILKNIAASVRQQLLNIARSDRRPFSELLQYFAMERFLYRLSKSSYADKYILKGALMLRVWQAPLFRPTMDIDMLGRNTHNEVGNIVKQIREICSVEVVPDGLEFNMASIKGERITEDADYEGVRIKFTALLDTARIPMQVDIGFGDVIMPEPLEAILPAMLDFPPPRLAGYTLESTIAEKFEAMVKLGELNSRMKDFYDVWLLSRQFDFTGDRLKGAIYGTLRNRSTKLPDAIVAFSESFIAAKATQWRAFHKRLNQKIVPPEFAEVVNQVKALLNPIVESIRAEAQAPSIWEAPGPWR